MGTFRGTGRPAALIAVLGLALPVGAQGDVLAEPFGPTFDWRDLLPAAGGDGSLGYVIINCGDEWLVRDGFGLRNAGDINGDGLADLLHNVDDQSAGTVAWGVLMGRRDRPALLDVSRVADNDGFQLVPNPAGANPVTGVGDINGDGFDDVVGKEVGVFYGSYTRIVFGRDERVSGPFPKVLRSADSTVHGSVYESVRPSITHGDVNDDGINDFMVSYSTDRGAWRSSAVLLFGRPSDLPFRGSMGVENMVVESGGMFIGADREYAHLSGFGGTIGDLNRDGVTDFAIGLWDTGPRQGAYVIFGRRAGDPMPVDFDPTQADSAEAVHFRIAEPHWRVSHAGTVGDINGDGIDDMGISAWQYGKSRLYIVFGRHDSHRDPFPPIVELDELNGDDGFILKSEDGWKLGGARPLGDVNGDDVDDLVLGDSIIYGREYFRFPAVLHPDGIAADQMVRFEGSDELRVSPLGDTNGDGIPDLALSVRGDDCEIGAVVFGRRPSPPCRADMDRDGAVTLFDWLTFATAWEASEPLADVDGDGEFSLMDYLVYQVMFHYGCP